MNNETTRAASKTPLYIGIIAGIIVVIAVAMMIGGRESVPADVTGSEGSFVAGQTATVKGTVVRNDTTQVPVDGPGFLAVRTGDGRNVEVIYSCGMMPVVNSEAYAAGSAAGEGQTVEAFGMATGPDAISICESQEYYIRTEGAQAGESPDAADAARTTPEYYANLRASCANAAGGEVASCCEASVDAMEQGGYSLAAGAGSCQSGYRTGMLTCASSLLWCEPEMQAS